MHFALVKKIWGPLFDHFVAIQIFTIWGVRVRVRIGIGIDFTSKLLGKNTNIGIGIANSVFTTIQANY